MVIQLGAGSQSFLCYRAGTPSFYRVRFPAALLSSRSLRRGMELIQNMVVELNASRGNPDSFLAMVLL